MEAIVDESWAKAWFYVKPAFLLQKVWWVQDKVVLLQQQFLPRLSTMRTTAGLRFYIGIWRIKEKSYSTSPTTK